MLHWLRERRKKREREAAARREQLRRKAGAPAYRPLESLLPDDTSSDAVNFQLNNIFVGLDGVRQSVEVTTLGSPSREFLDVNAPRVTQHHHGSGDNIAGSYTHNHSHTESVSHSHHSPSHDSGGYSHSHSYSHDSGSSYDSGSGYGSDSGSSW